MTTGSKRISFLKLLMTFLYILIFPVVVLYLSGDWFWPEGWIFSLWFITLCYSTIIYLYRKDPALLNERYQQPGAANQKPWDKFVVIGLFLGFIAWILIMPLDAKRWCWTEHFPFGLKIAGGVGLIISSYLFYRSYVDNTFLSPLVRIQTERKQHVVSTGVYGFVRHPMYLGGVLLFLCTPLLLGSMYGLLMGIPLVFLIMARIIGEEKMLSTELEGYMEYKKAVRYRLLPFVW